MITDIKKVIEAVKANEKANATVTNDVTIKGLSIFVAANANVDYWATLSLSKPIRGMYATAKDEHGKGTEFAIGLTTTVTVPLGSLVTCLFDALLDIDKKDKYLVGREVIGGQVFPVEKTLKAIALGVNKMKSIVVADAESEGTRTDDYVSHFSELVVGASISIITRDVFKEDGKVKSLFSLNAKENDVERDSVWADIYGLKDIDEDTLVDTYKWATAENAKKSAASADDASQNAVLAALQKAFAGNSAAGAINAALG